jgi:hypothetical protein
MSYEQKYLKYKAKYIALKNQSGGGKFSLSVNGSRVIIDRKRIAKIITVCDNHSDLGIGSFYAVDYVDTDPREREKNIKEDRIILCPRDIKNDKHSILKPGIPVSIKDQFNKHALPRAAKIIQISDNNGGDESYDVIYLDDKKETYVKMNRINKVHQAIKV